MAKVNFLQETLNVLDSYGKFVSDVSFVCDDQSYSSFDEFAKAADFEYDNGYGGNEINMNIMVVGENWWLERHEYDGSEWWEYKELPLKPYIHDIVEVSSR